MNAGRRVRVIDLETAGPGVTDVCEVGWQDVVEEDGGVWRLGEGRGSLLVNPGRPISPDTMAVHHIQDAEVANAPYWRALASDVLRPSPPPVALVAHCAAFEQRFCTAGLTGGAAWICTWKCALRVWPELPRFSNQMLRYLRRPEGLDHEMGLPAHRAFPDAYVTAHHLRDLLNAAGLAALLRWSAEPGLLPRVPSGPSRGRAFSALDATTLQTLARDRDIDVRFSARTELHRRSGSDGAPPPPPAGTARLL